MPCKAVAVFTLALEIFAEHASWYLQSNPMRYGACPSHHAPSSTDKHSNPMGSAGSSLINQSVRQRYAMRACFSPRHKCCAVASNAINYLPSMSGTVQNHVHLNPWLCLMQSQTMLKYRSMHASLQSHCGPGKLLLSTAQALLPSHDVLACFELQMNSLVVSPACAMHPGVDGACYSALDATSRICAFRGAQRDDPQ